MIQSIIRVVLSLLFLLTWEAAWVSAENIGAHVSGIRGKAYKFGSDGVIHPLNTGDKIKVGEFITTDKNSRVKLSFQDKTIVTLGESATVKLTDYMWSDAEQKGKFTINITEGFFRIIGGKITKNSPKFFVSETPVASIGIRGSSYAGRVSKAGLLVFLESGKGIDVYNSRGSVALLFPGRGTTVTSINVPPAQPRLFNSMEVDQIIRESDVEQGLSTAGSKIGPRAIIVNNSTITNSVNIAVGKNNRASMGSITIRGSEVDGTIVNEADIFDSSNISQGESNSATMGTIDSD